MTYKVIAKIMDGVIAVNNNNIICFHENSLWDNKGEDSLYHSVEGIYIGQILTEKNHRNADTYWHYTKKEWDKMNNAFQNIKI